MFALIVREIWEPVFILWMLIKNNLFNLYLIKYIKNDLSINFNFIVKDPFEIWSWVHFWRLIFDIVHQSNPKLME